jgi:hypothetical protein
LEDSSIIKNQEVSGKRKTFNITAIVAIIFLIFSFYFIFANFFSTAPFDGVQISVIPENRTIMKGQEFYADIFIDTKTKSVSAVQFNLFFNNSILKIKTVQERDFLKINETPTVFSPGKINNSGGTLLNVYGTMIKPGGNTSINNSFARITMISEASGNSSIELGNVIISGPDSEKYQVKILNGSIRVVE